MDRPETNGGCLPDNLMQIIKDVRKVVESHNPSGTAGECWSASFAVAMRLANEGVPVRLAQGSIFIGGEKWRHSWAELELNGTIVVDITADQFALVPGHIVVGLYRDLPEYERETIHSIDFPAIYAYAGMP